jgi:hypothetical protein
MSSSHEISSIGFESSLALLLHHAVTTPPAGRRTSNKKVATSCCELAGLLAGPRRVVTLFDDVLRDYYCHIKIITMHIFQKEAQVLELSQLLHGCLYCANA